MMNSNSHYLLLLLSMFGLATGANAQGMDVIPKGDELVVLSQIIDMGGFIRAVLAIFFAWLLLRFVDRIVNDMGSSYAERRLTLQRFNAFFHFVVYFAAFAFIILFSFNFSDRVIAIIGGTVVVGLGFATRDLLASIVAGIMIIFDRPFQVGDRVRFGGEYGDILSIGLRSVKLQTLDDSTVTIPNNMFLTEVASSGNSGELDMQVMVDLDNLAGRSSDQAPAFVLRVARRVGQVLVLVAHRVGHELWSLPKLADNDPIDGGAAARRAGAARGAMHPYRSRAATHPSGRRAPPKATFPCPLTALRSAYGARHRHANRA